LRRYAAQQSKKRAENYLFLRRNAAQQINAQKSNLFFMRRNATLQINFFCAEMPRSKLMHCFKRRPVFFLYNTISKWTSRLGSQQNMEFRLYFMARFYNYVLSPLKTPL
jgi:hypothetical protein